MAKQKSPPDADVIKYIMGGDPAAAPLPDGLHTDPSYLAFLRGLGFERQQASAIALQNIAAARGQFATTMQRLPAQATEERKNIDTNALDRGVFSSSERLESQNKARIADQERRQDAASAQSTAISQIQQGLGAKVGELARAQGDALGDLQGRASQQQNQDRYIAAVRGAAGGGGGGSGGFSLPQPAQPALAPTKPGAPDAGYRAISSNERRGDYIQALDPRGQMLFADYLHKSTAGSTDPAATLLRWIADDPLKGRPSQRDEFGAGARRLGRNYS